MVSVKPPDGPWMRSVPNILAQAIEAISEEVRPTSNEEFIAWVYVGLPPIRLRCGYRNGEAAGGAMHRVLVEGDEVRTPGHPAGEVERPGVRNACLAAALALRSSGPVAELPVAAHGQAGGRVCAPCLMVKSSGSRGSVRHGLPLVG
jgi:hypothetical protein